MAPSYGRHDPEAPQETPFISGIVLAGGHSARLGQDKALLRFGSQTLLQEIARKLLSVAAEVIIVGPREGMEQLPQIRVVRDLISDAGPLVGLLSGLEVSRHAVAVAVSCDLPFLNPRLLTYLGEQIKGYDAVVPWVKGRPQPLHAIYSRSCLPSLYSFIDSGLLGIAQFLDSGLVSVRYVGEEELRAIDAELLSFFNINTPDDLERAHHLKASLLADPGDVPGADKEGRQ